MWVHPELGTAQPVPARAYAKGCNTGLLQLQRSHWKYTQAPLHLKQTINYYRYLAATQTASKD